MFFGLLRPYKGLDVLLDAWRGIDGAELWVVGRPRMPLADLRARAPASVRFVPRFVSDAELPAFFRRADVVVLPYSRTERFDSSGVLATALAFGKPTVVSDVGGFGEVAARRRCAAGAARRSRGAPGRDRRAARAIRRSARGSPGARWPPPRGRTRGRRRPRETLALYRELVP